MKLHTAEKFCRSLPEIPGRSQLLSLRFSRLIAETECRLKIKIPTEIPLVIVGSGAEYAASIVNAAIDPGNTGTVAMINTADNIPLNETVLVAGKPVSGDDAAKTVAAIRTAAKKLCVDDPELYSELTRFEVRFLTSLCLCAESSTVYTVIRMDTPMLRREYAAVLPRPAMVLITGVTAADISSVKAFCGKRTADVVSSPQTEETNRAVASLCADLNCRHNVIAKGQLLTGKISCTGIPFSYRGIEAVARTCFTSLAGVAAAAASSLKILSAVIPGLTAERISEAVSSVSGDPYGNIISLKPPVVCRTGSAFNIGRDSFLASDLEDIRNFFGAELVIVTDSDNEGNAVSGLHPDRFTGAEKNADRIIVLNKNGTDHMTPKKIIEELFGENDENNNGNGKKRFCLAVLGDKSIAERFLRAADASPEPYRKRTKQE